MVLLDINPGGAEGVTLEGHISEPANRSPASLETNLSKVPPFLPDQDYDMPIDEDDDMDIFLNLEGDDDPQHSSVSSKKRRLEEDEEHSSSYTYL